MAHLPPEEYTRKSGDELLAGYLEVPDAARQIKKSLRSFQRMIERREVPYVKFGNRKLIPIKGFRKTLEDRTQPAIARRGRR
jgi:hypothetical protein